MVKKVIKPTKKVVKKETTVKKIKKSPPSRSYQKCIDVIVKINELMIDYGDFPDKYLDQLVDAKKKLETREYDVITRLGASIAAPRLIDIDEASNEDLT